MRALLACAAVVVCALACTPVALGDSPPLVRIAGTGTAGSYVPTSPPGQAQAGPSTALGSANYIVPPFDSSDGGFVFTDTADSRVFRVTTAGTLQLIAGSGSLEYSANGTKWLEAGMPNAAGISREFNGYRVVTYGVPGWQLMFMDRHYLLNTDPTVGVDENLGPAANFGVGGLSNFGVDDKRYIAVDANGTNKIIQRAGGSDTVIVTENGPIKDVSADPNTEDAFFYTQGASSSVNYVTGAGTVGQTNHVVEGFLLAPPAPDRSLNDPTAVVALPNGGFLTYDGGNHRIRYTTGNDINTSSVTTIADSLETVGDIEFTPTGIGITQPASGSVYLLPASAITAGPSGFSTTRDPSFAFSSWDPDATFSCNLDGTVSACSSPSTPHGLTDGAHTFSVKATAVGAVDPIGATRTWTVDATPPAAFALTSPDNGAIAGDVFSWAAATDATAGIDRYELWIDGAKAAAVSDCGGSACSATPAEIGDGAHAWFVKAFDNAGNVRESEQRTVTRALPPAVSLSIAPARALVGRTVTFDASGSKDPNGSISRFEWDLDGDGSFETDTGSAGTTTRSYSKPQTLTIAVRATDNSGLASVATGQLVITVQPPGGRPLGVSINDGAQYTNDPNVTITAAWPSFASDAFVSNDGGFAKGVLFPVAEKIPWKLDSSGPERLPKTIYVRFLSGVQTSETYQDDIILDQTAPKILSASFGSTARGAATAAKKKTVTLKVSAKDNASGVGAAQVTANKRKPGKFLKFKKSLKVAPAKVLYVRVRDRAGNLSRWHKAVKR